MGNQQYKTLELGGLLVRIESQHPEPWPPADRRYSNFYVEDAGQPDETIVVDVSDDPPRAPGSEPSLSISVSKDRVELAHGTSLAFWDRAARQSKVLHGRENFAVDRINPEACLDSLIRIILSFRLLAQGGFLIHAAGLMRNDRGYLFPGHSGAGKSTLAAASAAHSVVLSDDLVLARLTEQGASIHGTPFFGSYEGPGPKLEAPLAGIFFLVQAERNSIRKLATADALPRLLVNYVFFGEAGPSSQMILDLALRVCEQVPMYELNFLPDASFWSLIDA
jgi:hypothetical protein